MKREDLRQCTFKIPEFVEYEHIQGGDWVESPRQGVFHTWGTSVGLDGAGEMLLTVGIVEDEEGQVYAVRPETIKFHDV